LVCGLGDECSIPSYDIIHLVLNDYNMITYFYFKCKSTWTLHIMIFDITWYHVMLNCLGKLFGHNSSDHSHLIQYNYKSSCKHIHLNKNLISVRLQAITSRLPRSKQIQNWYFNDWLQRISYEVPTLGTINCDFKNELNLH
jgi:hypothetical protein